MIAVKHLSAEIESVSILRDLSFTVPQSSMIALIGRNGAGKTTTMRAIMGQVGELKGSIQFDGQDLRQIPAYERVGLGIGYMPEDRRLIPQLTARENILLPAVAGRLPDVKKSLARIYDMMPEVEALQHRKALLLSGGQQKLVALSRALMAGRRALILDEPFEGVAPALVERLTAVFAELKRERKRTLFVSDSSLDHGTALYDDFVTIERGQIGRAPALRFERVTTREQKTC